MAQLETHLGMQVRSLVITPLVRVDGAAREPPWDAGTLPSYHPPVRVESHLGMQVVPLTTYYLLLTTHCLLLTFE